ncbi:MAG TPA: hypothetical protein VFY25_07790, partial [Anaerolineales bacterium]|nr:hypothetical protein [Anaerolineales bacterium]
MTVPTATRKTSQPDGHSANPPPAGTAVGEGSGVGLGGGAVVRVGRGLLVLVPVTATVGVAGSEPVTDRELKRRRA